MKTLNNFLICALVFGLGIINNSKINAQDCSNGTYYGYVDADADGIGEGEAVAACSDLTTSLCSNLNFTTGSYMGEVSWNITDFFGSIVYQGDAYYNGEVCLGFGLYTLNMIDSYGDGWNGCILNFNGESHTISGSVYSGSAGITISAPSPAYVLSGGDLCLDGIDPIVSVTTGFYTSEVSWNITSCAGEVLISGGSPFSSQCISLPAVYQINLMDSYGDGWNGNSLSIGSSNYTFDLGYSSTFMVGECPAVYGCTDVSACNYSNLATDSDETCIYLDGVCESCVDNLVIDNDSDNDGICDALEVIGCQDTAACNFNSLATDSNATLCEYTSCLDECGVPNGDNTTCLDQCGVVNGDNSSCTDVCGVINGSGYYNYYIDTDSDGLGEGDVLSSCTDLTQDIFCGTLSVSGGTYPSEVSWNIENSSGDYILSGAAPWSSEICLNFEDYTINMFDSYGDGWNGANLSYNDLSFTFESGYSSSSSISVTSGTQDSYVLIGGDIEITGCTNELADNFMSSANTDDGSCLFSGCTSDWADNFSSQANLDDGTCFLNGCIFNWADNYNIIATIDDGSCALDTCMANWADNYDANGTTDNGSCTLDACMLDWADNYDSNATTNDGSCYRLGCMSDWADDFDELATTDDGSCDRLGCIFDWADNYDELATTNDSSCALNACMYDWADNFDTNATNDDGSCDRLGCISDWADNYDSNATTNDGSCDRLGCMSDWADDFDELATTDDGSCDRLGCMSDWADNYDELATTNDGSCALDACVSDWADNYDANATSDDGSCDRLGCMSDWADNFDALATTDNESCELLACTEDWADNYNPNATYQLADEISVEPLLFSDFEVSVDSGFYNYSDPFYNSYYIDGSSNNIYQISSCMQGSDPYACYSAYQSLAPSYPDYWEFNECFEYSNSNMCYEASYLYPSLMEDYLTSLDADSEIIQYCLQGDGYACISAANVLSEYTWEIQSCLQEGDYYACEMAATYYSSELAEIFDYNTSELFSASLNLTIPQTGDYLISYFYDANQDEQIFYSLNSDTTFLTFSGQTQQINFTANSSDVISFGMIGNQLGQLTLSNPVFNNSLGSPSCFKEGCMSDWADNYDDLSTIDNGSCVLSACMSEWADNYDINATIDDDSCDRLGCMSDWADNYDSISTSDDESCYRVGCMSDWADNYDSIATISFGSPVESSEIGTISCDYNNSIQNIENNTFLEFSVNSLTQINFNTQYSQYDTYLNIFDSQGNLIISNDDYYGLQSNIDIELAQGDYTILLTNCCNGWSNIATAEQGISEYGSYYQGESGILNISVSNSEECETDSELECFRMGCMDATACNYDDLATEDDGSCGTVLILNSSMSEYYCSTYSWSVISTEQEFYEGTCNEIQNLCLSEGDYYLVSTNSAESSWWASWTFASISEFDYLNTYTELDYEGDSISIPFSIVYGCTDELADNYLPASTIEDESCLYVGCIDQSACNYDEIAYKDDGSCIYITANSCELCVYDVSTNSNVIDFNDVDGDNVCDQNEVIGCTNPLACNFDSYATDEDGSCIVPSGCQQCVTDMALYGSFPTYPLVEFDEDLDGICDQDETEGCTDLLGGACNYNAAATDDNGTCQYPELGYNCSGECVVGQHVSFGGGQFIFESSFEIYDCDDHLLIAAGGEPFETCMDITDTYVVHMFDTQSNGWDGNELVIGVGATNTFTLTAEDGDFAIGGTCEGCTNTVATNYDSEAFVDDSTCEFIYGCMNPDAVNYDPNATQSYTLDNCYVSTAQCSEDLTEIVVSMSDSYGDGWNGNNLVIGVANDDGLINDGSSVGDAFTTGSQASANVCVNMDMCNNISVGGGSWEYEVSWTIALLSNPDDLLVSGNAPENMIDAIGACDQPCPITTVLTLNDSYGDGWNGASFNIEGEDPITFNSGFEYQATTCADFSSCLNVSVTDGDYPGEISWSLSLPDGTPISGGSSYEGEIGTQCGGGCTDIMATNYNAFATEENNSCIYQSEDCPTGYVLDCDGTGECINSSWIGDNFGDCEDQTWGADLTCYANDGGDCNVYGCIDSIAINFNSLANVDDDSCVLPIVCEAGGIIVTFSSEIDNNCSSDGGTNDSYWMLSHGIPTQTENFAVNDDNYQFCLSDDCYTFNMYNTSGIGWCNSYVTVQDLEGSILAYQTLIDGSSNSFDFGLNYDVGDCGEIYGCTDSIALNYDPLANLTNGNCVMPIYGCIDITANNYNSLAHLSDNSCSYRLDCSNNNYSQNEFLLGDGYCDMNEQTANFNCAEFNYDNGDCGPTFDCSNNNYFALEYLIGDDNCNMDANSLNFNCAEFDYDQGDCGPILDCSGSNYYGFESLIGDGNCDLVGINYGFDFNCESLDFDDGDCEPIYDCEDNNYVGMIFLIGNTQCDTGEDLFNFNCDEFNYDGGDCGPLFDCQDNNFFPYQNLLGDSLCHNGMNDLGVDLNCAEFDYDQGDCGPVFDCTGNNYFGYEFMLGDGYCDYGALDFNFNCDEFSYDQGDCDDLYSDEIIQFDLVSNQSYVLKNGDCRIDPFYLSQEDYFIVGLDYNETEVTVQDFSFEFEHVSSPSTQTPIVYGDTIYMKMNNLYVSYQIDFVSLTADIENALPIVLAPFSDVYYGIQLTNYDKFNIFGYFDDDFTDKKHLKMRTVDNMYQWIDIDSTLANQFVHYRLSNYGDYADIICGCTNSDALNYDQNATENDYSCAIEGCMESQSNTFNPLANIATPCDSIIEGCVYDWAFNYNHLATYDDGTCIPIALGCNDSTMLNFDPLANTNDYSCIPVILGCDDSLYLEYDSLVNFNIDLNCINLIITGCTDSLYLEYNSMYNTLVSDSCQILISEGCTDSLYIEFDYLANTDDETCIEPIVYGCLEIMFMEYDSFANTDDGSCEDYIVIGCSDINAINYNPAVTIVDNTLCQMDETFGCTEFIAFNYNPNANTNDGSCIDAYFGCTYQWSYNFDSLANTDNGTCALVLEGCTEPSMFNFSLLANVNDGSCVPVVEGCTIYSMFNFLPAANTDNNTCVPVVFGCMESEMFNYDETANTEDSSCIPVFEGCTDSTYLEFNQSANIDNNTCDILVVFGCIDSDYVEFNSVANTDTLNACVIQVYSGCQNPLYVEFNQMVNTDDGTCEDLIIMGCIDSTAFNFDSLANTENNSCVPIVNGCLSNLYMEFNSSVNVDDGSCEVLIELGCMDESMYNYNSDANIDNGLCFEISTIDISPYNYQFNMSVTAQIDISGILSTDISDSILFISTQTNNVVGFGTLQLQSSNNNYYAFITAFSNQVVDQMNVYLLISGDGSDTYAGTIDFIPNSSLGSISEPIIFTDNSISPENIGCTDPAALNYNLEALLDDSSCQYPISGCMDSEAVNFNVSAVQDDSSCEYNWEDAYLTQVVQIIDMETQMTNLVDSLSEVNLTVIDLQTVIDFLSNSETGSNSLLIDSLQQELIILQNSSNQIQPTLIDYFIDFPEGWSMFGYNCYEPQDISNAFISQSDKIVIIKDEYGSSFFPNYNFNGIGDLNYAEGYLIKTNEVINQFQFCKILILEE